MAYGDERQSAFENAIIEAQARRIEKLLSQRERLRNCIRVLTGLMSIFASHLEAGDLDGD